MKDLANLAWAGIVMGPILAVIGLATGDIAVFILGLVALIGGLVYLQ